MTKKSRAALDEAFGVKTVLLNSDCVSAQSRARLFWCNFPLLNLPREPDPARTLVSVLEPMSAEFKQCKSQAYVLTDRSLRRIRHTSTRAKSATLLASQNILLDQRFRIPLVRYFHRHEMERLQTFPHGFCDALSPTKCQEALGRAVTVELVVLILKNIANT